MRSAVALLSGGMDSTTLAYYLRAQLGPAQDEPNLYLLSFNYGQRHKKELEFAYRTAAKLNAPHRVVDLSGLRELLAGSALTSPEVEVPEGHYTATTMKATVVPNRNMIMLAIASGLAVSKQLEAVATAVHAGDHAIYPDCRPEFIEALREAIWRGNEGFGPPSLYAPFIMESKAQIAELGAKVNVPWVDTWSCYKGGERHCGKCGTCVERIEAFQLAGIVDPTDYE